MAGELRCLRTRRASAGKYLAPPGLDIRMQREHHGLASPRGVGRFPGYAQSSHARRGLARLDHHLIAHLDATGLDGTGVAAVVLVGAHHELDRQAKVAVRRLRNRSLFQGLEQGGSCVPGHAWRTRRDVITIGRHHRDGHHSRDTEFDGQRLVCSADILEHGGIESHQVHLVDRQDDLPDAHQSADVAVSLGLGEQAFARIHQHHGE